MKKTIVWIILINIFLVNISFSQTNEIQKTQSKIVTAPNIVAIDIYGKKFELYSFTDKPKIIQFMRIYCGGRIGPQSAQQFSQLVSVYEKYKDKIVFVTITISSCQSSDLKEIVKYFGIKWPFINDFSDYKLDIIQAYSDILKNLKDPALVFLSNKNEIVSTTNFCDDKKLEEEINKIIPKTLKKGGKTK